MQNLADRICEPLNGFISRARPASQSYLELCMKRIVRSRVEDPDSVFEIKSGTGPVFKIWSDPDQYS